MYYDPLFLVLFVEGRMHGLHWGGRVFSGGWSDRAFDVRRWGGGRVDSELIALAAHE